MDQLAGVGWLVGAFDIGKVKTAGRYYVCTSRSGERGQMEMPMGKSLVSKWLASCSATPGDICKAAKQQSRKRSRLNFKGYVA